LTRAKPSKLQIIATPVCQQSAVRNQPNTPFAKDEFRRPAMSYPKHLVTRSSASTVWLIDSARPTNGGVSCQSWMPTPFVQTPSTSFVVTPCKCVIKTAHDGAALQSPTPAVCQIKARTTGSPYRFSISSVMSDKRTLERIHTQCCISCTLNGTSAPFEERMAKDV
jgi:hypothetical protein